MDIATLVMGAVAVALVILGYLQGDALHLAGLKAGWTMFRGVFPLLIAAFVIAGMIQVLLPRALVTRWLGEEAGFRGILIGCAAGGLTPGGPYVIFPIAASLYQAGVGIGVIVGYVAAWGLWSLGRLPFEVSLISPKFTLIRFVSTLAFPPLAGLIAHLFFKGA